MREAERERRELEEAQQRAEEARRQAEAAAHSEKAEREAKVNRIAFCSTTINLLSFVFNTAVLVLQLLLRVLPGVLLLVLQ